VNELKQRKRQRMHSYIGLSAVAACLAVTAGVGIVMPRVMAGLFGTDYANTSMMASIFYENNAIGYVLTGLLAFSLGVCATALCYRLKSGKQHDKGNQNNGGNH